MRAASALLLSCQAPVTVLLSLPAAPRGPHGALAPGRCKIPCSWLLAQACVRACGRALPRCLPRCTPRPRLSRLPDGTPQRTPRSRPCGTAPSRRDPARFLARGVCVHACVRAGTTRTCWAIRCCSSWPASTASATPCACWTCSANPPATQARCVLFAGQSAGPTRSAARLEVRHCCRLAACANRNGVAPETLTRDAGVGGVAVRCAQGVAGVLELATSTLAMFAARPAVHQALLDAGAVPVLVKLLSPLFPTVRAAAAATVARCPLADKGSTPQTRVAPPPCSRWRLSGRSA